MGNFPIGPGPFPGNFQPGDFQFRQMGNPPPTGIQPVWGYYPRLFNVLSALAPQAATEGASRELCLRWWVSPELGFPRMPFEVWQRRSVLHEPSNVQMHSVGNDVFAVDEGPLLWLCLSVNRTNSSAPLSIEALDERGERLPGQVVVVPPAQNSADVIFYYPNINQIRLKGGTLKTTAYGSPIKDWEPAGEYCLILTEAVGLPLKTSEISPASYVASIDGEGLARQRLEKALSQLGPPPALPGFSGSFAWPKATADDLIAAVRFPKGLVAKVQEVLERAEPVPSVLGWQAQQEVKVATNFLSSGPLSDPDPNEIEGTGLQIIPLALMAAATDPLISVALGFGTSVASVTFSSFPHAREPGWLMPSGYGFPNVDTFITVNYLLPDGADWKWTTLMAVVPPPIPTEQKPSVPSSFAAVPCHYIPPNEPNPSKRRPLRTPPEGTDGPFRQDVRLTWNLNADDVPGGFVLACARGGNNAAQILNQQEGNHVMPLLPAQRTDGDAATEKQVLFVDVGSEVPLSGNRTDKYYCAALDVFGNWSEGWAQTPFSLQAEPPQIPAIISLSVQLSPLKPGPDPTPRKMQATLKGTWSWNIQDRTPLKVEFAGVFFDPLDGPPSAPGSTPAVSFVVDFTMNPPAPVVDTEANGTKGTAGIVNRYEFAPPQLPPTDILRRFPGLPWQEFAPKFTPTPPIDIDFTKHPEQHLALYARAWETVDPGVVSSWSLPATTVAFDPVPPNPPAFDAVLLWSAMADAMGVARATISFPAVPYATGYVVYEADDISLLDAAEQAPTSNDPNSRLSQLALLFATQEEKTRDVFRRVFRDAIPEPKIEVALPGLLTGIRVYRVVAVSATQVESSWSAPVYVAVPRRLTPMAPELQVRVLTPANQARRVNIVVLPATKGATTARVEIYRTTSAELATDVDLMGPPVATLKVPPEHYIGPSTNRVPFSPGRGRVILMGDPALMDPPCPHRI